LVITFATCKVDSSAQASSAETTNASAAVDPQRVVVKARAGRFEPAEIHLIQGVPAVLEFTRVADSECMKAVRMPWMNEPVTLPLNEKVEIPVDTSMTGVFSYSCWMNMVFGEVVIEEAD
jgi:plastocyanin domain-containing protein